MFTTIVILSTCVKLLLIPSYRSTDFEVHRNWLAITNTLPPRKWYFEDTSEWMLDYPPLFAWFEYLLSLLAQYFDPKMLNINNLYYASFETVLFQRLSVIVTDLVYIFGVKRCCSALPKGWQSDVILPLLLITNIGLFMVDHVHFQYNGVMYGLLLLSIADIMQGNYLAGSFWFAFLLNMKHIYVYLAPAYFVYLLKNYCFQSGFNRKNLIASLTNCFKLGTVVIGVFLVSFAPFYDHVTQVLSRMFPFKRGLCHAYWAPNVWALYNIADKGLTVIATKMNLAATNATAAMTGGLVQEFAHTILMNITPLITIVLTGSMMLPGMIKLWRMNKTPLNFVRYVVICALTSFLFGWHVHEKAILMAIVPLSLLAVLEPEDAKVFLMVSTVGHYSLFPLLFPDNLLCVKVVLFIAYTSYAFYSLSNLYPFQLCKFSLPLLNLIESLYLLGLIVLLIYDNFVHSVLRLDEKLPFLPLMMTSVYCAVGLTYSWLRYYVYFMVKCK